MCGIVGRIIGTYTVDGQTIEYSITGKQGESVLVLHWGHSNCILLKTKFISWQQL